MSDAARCKDCASPPREGGRRCEPCSLVHNEREAARRAERKAHHRCSVCGDKCVRQGKIWLSTCVIHREYFNARARV